MNIHPDVSSGQG